MTDVERVSYDALDRTKVFGVKYATDWTPVPPAVATSAEAKTIQLYGDLTGIMSQLKPTGAQQVGGATDYHAGTTHKAVLRVALLAELHGLHDTAATLAVVKGAPQIMDKFRLPHGNGDREISNVAGEIADAAEALSADFIALGHDAGFVDALRLDIVNFEAAKDEQGGGLESQAGNTALTGKLIGAGLVLLKQLRVSMNNRYKADAEKLGEWQTAQHVEKLSHKKRAPKPA